MKHSNRKGISIRLSVLNHSNIILKGQYFCCWFSDDIVIENTQNTIQAVERWKSVEPNYLQYK